MSIKINNQYGSEYLALQLIRQADSMDLDYGDEFDEFMVNRMFIPENKTNAALGKTQKDLNQWLDKMSELKAHYHEMKMMLKWCFRNKGMSIEMAEGCLNSKRETIEAWGKYWEELGFGPDFSKLLDGSDNSCYHAPPASVANGLRQLISNGIM